MADRTITVTLEVDADIEGIDEYIEQLETAETALDELERKADTVDLTITAQDEATEDVQRVEAAIERLSTQPNPNIQIDAQDEATDDIHKVQQSLNDLEQSEETEIKIEAIDAASDDIAQAGEALEELGDKTDKAGQKAKETKTQFGNLKDEIGGAIAAFGLMEVGQKVVELFNLGGEVNRTKLAFESLTKPMGDATEILEELQRVTGGAVDDLTLMASSTTMIKLGLADTPERLTELIDTAFALTGSAEGVENFVSALANASYLRLDTLGISASDVRVRVEQLTKAGMDMNQAFVQAAMEGAAETLERLGSAAQAAETPVANMLTGLKNIGLNIAAGFEAAIQGITGIVQYSQGILPQQQVIREEATRLAEIYVDEFSASMVMNNPLAGQAMLSGEEVYVQALAEMFDAVATDPTVLQSKERLAQELSSFGLTGDQANVVVDSFLKIYNEEYARDLQQAEYNRYATEEAIRAQNEMIQRTVTAQRLGMGGVVGTGIPGLTELVQAEEQVNDLRESWAIARSELKEDIVLGNPVGFEDAQVTFREFVDAYDELAAAEIPDVLDPAIAEEVNEQYDNAVRKLEEMNELADQGLISGEQLTQAQQMVDDLGAVKDAADKAAKAFEDLSLATVFGQDTDVNMFTEMLDRVLEDPRIQALGEKKVDTFGNVFALATGEETAASQAFDQVFMPMLIDAAATRGPEIAAAMADAAATALEQATLAGVDTTSADFVQQLTDAIAPMAEGGAFDASAFVEELTTASEKVTDISEATPDMAGDFQSMELAATGMADKFPLIEQGFKPAQRAAEDLAETLRVMASKPVTIRVNLDVQDVSGLIAALGGSVDLARAVGESTRRTGGGAPGVSNR